MNMFTEYAKSILASPVTMLVLTFICALSTLEFGRISLSETKPYAKIIITISSIIISVTFTCVMFFSPTAANPIFAITIGTAAVFLVSITFTKDKFFSRIYLAAAFIMLLSLCYSLIVGLVGLGFLNIEMSAAGKSSIIIFTNLYLILPAIWVFLMTFPKTTRLSNFKLVIHSDSTRAKILFFYFLIFDFGIMITLHFVFDIISNNAIMIDRSHDFFRILVLKDMVILISSLYVFVSICHLEYVAQKQSRSDMLLKREYIIKNSSHQNKLIEYVVNTTNGVIVEGLENFLPNVSNTSEIIKNEVEYKKMIQASIKRFVHPEDIAVFTYIGNQDFYTDKLKHNPFYSIRFRVSPDAAIQTLNLPDKVKNRLRAKKKEWIYLAANCTVFMDEKIGSIMFYTEIDDVDDEVNRELELLANASEDSLTKLLNRRGASEQISRVISKGLKAGSIFMLDLDNFKTVNDEMGHPEGDKLLQETSQILKNEFRTNDIVARLGGDEFLIFAPELANLSLIKEKAIRICKKLNRTITAPGNLKIETSTSIGIALFPKDGNDEETLYKNVDQALYEAKKRGKNKYKIFSN